jgi:hypothetical protein
LFRFIDYGGNSSALSAPTGLADDVEGKAEDMIDAYDGHYGSVDWDKSRLFSMSPQQACGSVIIRP